METTAAASLSSDCMLHLNLTECINTITQTTPASTSTNLLPSDASSFFSHYNNSNTVSHLQHDLHTRAVQHTFYAAVDRAAEEKDIVTSARLNCITAPHAADWKAAIPSNSDMKLNDSHYRLAARLNLGMTVAGLPDYCYGCGRKDSVKIDPYHYLSCTTHKRREITIRHNLVLQVLYRYINYVGGVAVKEPIDLNDTDGRRPDLQVLIADQHMLSDVRISHPLCPSHVEAAARQQLATAKIGEKIKQKKYRDTATQHQAKFVAFVMESTGGMGADAIELMHQIVLASRDNNTLWPHKIVARELRGALAIAVQKGNAMTMIAGRNLAIGRAATCYAA